MARCVETDILGRPIIFDYPDRLVAPAAWVGHIPFAFWLVDAHRPKLLAELGTHSGNSYSAFTQAVQRTGLDTRCFAVDTWRGDAHSGFYGEEIFDEFSRYHETRYGSFSQLVRATFDQAVSRFEPGSIDLLHIDGLHTYEAAKHDFETWLKVMSLRGVVLLHDVHVRDHQFGVWKLWDELSARYPHFMFTHSNGLGVVGVGQDIGEPLNWLFQLGRDDATRQDQDRVRTIFERLGSGLTDRVVLAESEVRSREAIQAAESERDRLVAYGETVQRENAARGQHIGELEKAVRALQAERAAMAQQGDAVNRENLGRGQQIVKLERAFYELQAERDEIARRAESLDHDHAARGERIEELRKALRLRQAERGDATHEAVAAGRKDSAPDDPDRTTSPSPAALAGVAERLKSHPLFDAGWYVERNPHVAASGMDTLEHYLKVGAAEGLDPHPLFATRWYLAQNPEVAATGMNPLAHYVMAEGARERFPNPLFDVSWYLERHPDVAAAGIDPLVHYARFGGAEGRNPHPMFDTAYYLARNPQAGRSGMSPLAYYLQHGMTDGHDPHRSFDRRWYLTQYPDVAASGMNPFIHYVHVGKAEGREPRSPAGAGRAGDESSGAASSSDPVPGHAAHRTIEGLRGEIAAVKQLLAYHAHRLDYALGMGEGVLDLSEELRRARATPNFWKPFERGNPLVSICIATCNRAPILIDRCIRSLQAQTYQNIQIVVVGDHCTDDTGYRLAQLRDDRIVFVNLPQRGPYPSPSRARWQVAGSNAMNRALDLAEGDFIAHLDDDDEAAFDRIEATLEHAQSNRAEFCWHPFWYEDPDGTWRQLGNGEFALGQMTTGSTFYHRFYARIKWNVESYQLDEPGDWNRLRKIKLLRPSMAYLGKPLTFHFKEKNQGPFVPQLGETFLN